MNRKKQVKHNKKVLRNNIIFLMQLFNSFIVLFNNNLIFKILLIFSTIYMFLYFIFNIKIYKK